METTKEKIARYDRDQNKVIVTIREELEIKDGENVVGMTKNTFIQDYSPEHIHKLEKTLHEQKVQMEKALSDIERRQEEKLDFEYDELVLLKKKLQSIGKLDKMEQDKNTKETIVKNLKVINEDLRVLSGVIKSMPK